MIGVQDYHDLSFIFLMMNDQPFEGDSFQPTAYPVSRIYRLRTFLCLPGHRVIVPSISRMTRSLV